MKTSLTTEQVKEMTHVDRMAALGQTVKARMHANWVLVHPKASNDAKRDAAASHELAARDAALLRY